MESWNAAKAFWDMLQGPIFSAFMHRKRQKKHENALHEHPCVIFMSNISTFLAKTARKIAIKTPKCVMFLTLPRAATVDEIFVKPIFS